MFKRCNACTAGYYLNKQGSCDCGGVLEDSYIDEAPTIRIPNTARIIAKNSERRPIIVTARPKPLVPTGSFLEIK